MTRTRAIGLPAAFAIIALSIAAPTAAHAVGDGGDQVVHVGAEGAGLVEADSVMAQIAPAGCGRSRSNTTVPSTIRVLRGSGNVDVVPFKSYVENVLPNEWVSSWSPASLRAGAIAVKSFAWFWVNHSAYRISPGGQCYDVTDDTRSQVYRPGSATAATNAAVEATWATRLTRGGAVLQAHYCATSTACGAWVDGDWMSQDGSQELARTGADHTDILRHYYRDVVVSGAPVKHPPKDPGKGHAKPAPKHRTKKPPKKRTPKPLPKAKPGEKVYRQVWTTTASYGSRTSGGIAGVLHEGKKYFYCQAKGARVSFDGHRNNWWLKTDDDSGHRNVWVSATGVDGSRNNRAVSGVPAC